MSIFRRPHYTPLPTNSPSPRRRTRWPPWQAIAIVVTAICILLAWVARRTLFGPPLYSPLIDYQYLNPPPLLSHPRSHPATYERRAVVSTLYSDSYAIGASVLLHSIKTHNISASHFFLAYLPGRISNEALCVVRAAGWDPVPVPFIPPPHGGKDVHHRFFDQYTKLNIWGLDASKVVYLDADTLVRKNFDELFEMPWAFAAVPDVYGDRRGFTIGFNAGVMLYTPDEGLLRRMKEMLEIAKYPLEQAEQSFLNLFFAGSAVRLPYAYNANLAIKKVSPELWRGMGEADEMRVVHYTLVKPFVDERDRSGKMLRDEERVRQIMDEAETKEGGMFKEEVGWWREAFENMVGGNVGAGMIKCKRAALLA
ncbi:hypothetical protein H2248_003616 [Termitomyces sp. 'cryptogamus']|nr:hypothetical protein H2248_003616 [Termitomyces sp. 'cryptogamus']